MQDAATVLDVLHDRGRRGLPCDELYRQMFNKELYLLAYGRICANQGAMTPGATGETADGMSGEKIDAHHRGDASRALPVLSRPDGCYIPKKNGKMRPLGLPTWSDKLVGEVVRLLLEAYYEPAFSGHSHGFRPQARLPHCPAGNGSDLDRDRVVHRGRHFRLFRVFGSRYNDQDPGGEDPR